MKEELKKLIKKEFQIEIEWNIITYPQLSYYECLEFDIETDWDSEKIKEWMYQLLNKYSNWKLNKESFFKLDLVKLWEVLVDSAFKWYFYKQKKEKSFDEKAKEKLDRKIPWSWWIIWFSERFHLDPTEILKKYTPEQLTEYQSWIYYINNELTEEGKKRNDKDNLRKQEEYKFENDLDTDLEILKKNEEKMINNLKEDNNLNK